jgi:hypothetical protein
MNTHLKDGRDASKLQEDLSTSIATTSKPPPPSDSEPTEEPSGN